MPLSGRIIVDEIIIEYYYPTHSTLPGPARV